MASRLRLLSPVAFARRNAVYKGLFGGQRGWLVVGVVLWGTRLLKRTFGRQPEPLGTEVLRPGQFVRVEAIRPLTRRERRAARRG